MRKISKRTREIAADALAFGASSDGCTVGDCWDAAGLERNTDEWKLEARAFGYVCGVLSGLGVEHEIIYAEAESLLRTGWTPEGWR